MYMIEEEATDTMYEHTLHWVEAMSWMGKISEAIDAMALLESFTQVRHLVCGCDPSKGRKLTLS